MSWFSGSTVNVEELISSACSESIPNGEIDYNRAFEIVDLIKIKKIKVRDFLTVWESRILNNKNPNNQISLLNLVDLCIKNSGINFSLELFAGGGNADNDSSYGTIRNQFLNKLLFILHNTRTNEQVKDKILELVETWHVLFAQNSNLNHNINLLYNTLKDEKFVFPKIDNKIIFNEKFLESKVPPVWVDSDSCMINFEPFTMLNRKHHCRNCGGVFCQLHSSKSVPIPMMGLNEPVRVCDSCYEQLTSKSVADKPKHVSPRVSEEDEMLKKALELSLQESQQNNHPNFGDKNVAVGGETINSYINDEEDEQMKAAIAASLKDLEQQKKAQQTPTATEQQSQYPNVDQFNASTYVPPNTTTPFEPLLQHELESKVSSSEEDSIYLFSQLMTNLKQQQENGQQSADQILQNQELQGLYTEIIKLKTKLGRNINEDLGKYEQFIDLQQKLGMIVRLYDSFLEKRLSLRGYNRNSYSGVSPYAPHAPSGMTPNYTGIPNNYPSATGGPYQVPLATGSQYQPVSPPTPQQQPLFVHDPYTEASTSEFSAQVTGQTSEQVTGQATGPHLQPSEPPQVNSEPSQVVPASQTSPLPHPPVPPVQQNAPQQAPSAPPSYHNISNMFPSAPTTEFREQKSPQKEEPVLIEL